MRVWREDWRGIKGHLDRRTDGGGVYMLKQTTVDNKVGSRTIAVVCHLSLRTDVR